MLTELERSELDIAAVTAGYQFTSAWARELLLSAARSMQSTTEKPTAIPKKRIRKLTDDLND